MISLSEHFSGFRKGIIGNDFQYETPYGRQTLLYADWVASGRLYDTIEQRLTDVIGPWVGNTHTETSETGQLMTKAYHHAHQLIKKHVNAAAEDV